MPKSKQSKVVNVRQAGIARMKNSPSPKGIAKAKTNTKGKSSKNLSVGSRQSKRLQQKTITESWPENVQKKEKWPVALKKATKKTVTDVADDIKDEIQYETPVKSSDNKVKETSSTVPMSPMLEGLKREEKLEILRNFDLEGLYGPCRGISRRSRFERALTFNLRPVPEEIIVQILDSHPNDPQFERCIWDCNELLRVKLGSPIKKQ